MKKIVTFQKILITFLATIIVFCCLTYKYNLSAVSKKSNKIEFEVTENQTFSSIAKNLKEKNLIKSEFFYKLYVKLMKPTGLQVGTYELNQNMTVEKIVNTLSKGAPVVSSNVTFKEGINMRKVISLITENTDITEKEILDKLNDKEYLNSLINQYWFLTDDILNENIYYSLEGYLYPNTYQIASHDSLENIFKAMLDEMNNKLINYKKEIEKSDYTIHEILTLASIVELEGSNSNDRSGVAGVFYNRLKSGWSLGSDVTTYYGAKVDMSERDLYQSEINAYNAYNTRNSKMAGLLPIGPICNPSIESIKAVLNPTDHNYYYFVADKTGKTYFSKTANEHVKKVNQLKSEGLWYEY